MGIEAFGFSDVDNRIHRINRANGCAADADHHTGRVQPGFAISPDGFPEALRAHGVIFVSVDFDQIVLADPGDPAGLVNAGMGLGGGIDAGRFFPRDAGADAAPVH